MAKKILSCLFFFSICCYSLAQKVTEERLKSIIFDIQFSTAGDREIKKIDSIISICHQENYRDCEVFGYLKIANIYNKNNDIKKAFHYTDLIEKKNLITSETDFEAVFYFYTIRSLLHQKLGERVAALKLLDDISFQVKENPYYEYLIDWQYAGIYTEMGENKKALKAYRSAYLKAKEYRKQPGQNTAKNKNKISNSYKPAAYLAGAYQKLGKMDSAKIYIEEGLQDARSLDEVGLQYIASFYAAEYYLKTADFKKAQQNLWICKNIAVHHYKSENYQESVITDLINLYEKTGEKDSADYYSRQLLKVQSHNDAQNKIQKDILDKKKLTEEGSKTMERKTLIYLCIGLFVCLTLIFIYLFYNKKTVNKEIIPVEIPFIQDNNLFEQVIVLAKENNPEFLTRFNDYCPGFSGKLVEAAQLKSSEIRFCAYVYLNFSTKDIAAYTYTSVRTVQTKKYRIRKKLNIPNDTEIYLWFRDLMK
ncbi:tetratricopeptide repeat protein [Chryseobacterium sp. JM1]|uniref:tetratricopeptide repeat protein n=1 Tax=Chryseobacterium sp. JM1 TaxID=1233950 RepID=UPI000B01F2A2|nr:LuxR C-terminal-related transcriptional regulator [Chryseobacterium sp. JM1]